MKCADKDEKMTQFKILLIIPAYNEAEGIIDVISKVDDYRKKSDYQLDYIVINDGSTDNEEDVLMNHQICHVELVHNLGIGGAVQTGYMYALNHEYDIAVQYDGDGQHDINSLSNLVRPIIQGEVDFTVGSRFVQGSESHFKSTGARQIGIKILSWLIKILTGIEIKDVTSGFRAGNKKVIKEFVQRYPSKYPEPESYMLLFKKSIRMKEVGVKMFERSTGQSSISIFNSISYMIHVSLSILFSALIDKEETK